LTYVGGDGGALRVLNYIEEKDTVVDERRPVRCVGMLWKLKNLAGPMNPFPEQMDVRDPTQPRSFELDESGRPKKQAKISAPSQQVMAVMGIDHEDEPNFTHFENEDIGYMEDYDYAIEDEQMSDEVYAGDVDSMLDRVSRPRRSQKLQRMSCRSWMLLQTLWRLQGCNNKESWFLQRTWELIK